MYQRLYIDHCFTIAHCRLVSEENGLSSHVKRRVVHAWSRSCGSDRAERVDEPDGRLDPNAQRAQLGDREPTGVPVGAVVELAERSEEHTSELQSRGHLVCRLL